MVAVALEAVLEVFLVVLDKPVLPLLLRSLPSRVSAMVGVLQPPARTQRSLEAWQSVHQLRLLVDQLAPILGDQPTRRLDPVVAAKNQPPEVAGAGEYQLHATDQPVWV